MARTAGRECQITPGTGTGPAASTLTKNPERERGLWSFLTWSFVLSELMAAGSFFGKGAQADAQTVQDQVDDGGRHGPSHSGSIEDMPGAASGIAAAADDIQEDEAAQHNNHAPQPVLHLDNLQYGGKFVELKPASSDAGHDGGGGGGGGSGEGGGGGGGGGSDSGDSISPGAHGPGSPGADGAGLNVGVDLKHLLGFDVHLGTDGVLIGVDGSLALDLNPDHLVSDLAQTVGLSAGVDLNHLLGFAVHLGTDGVFVVSDLAQTVGLNAGVDLNHLLLPQLHGSSSLIDNLSHHTGLPSLVADLTNGLTHVGGGDGAIFNVLNSAHDLIGGVMGVAGLGNGPIGDVTHVLGLADGGSGLLSGVARIPALLGKAGGAEGIVQNVLGDASHALSSGSPLTQSMDALTGQSGNGVTLNGSPVTHVVSDVTSIGGLVQNGDISSGDTIDFPAQALTQVDELFSGNRYTDYNVTLQSHNPDMGKIGATLTSGTVDHTAVLPAPVDIPSGTHDAGAPPLKGVQETNASLVHIPTPIEELSVHGHSV